jgi:uncharacterized protein
MMSIVKTLAVVVLAGYCGLAAVLYFFQRSMMYFPATDRATPAGAGFAKADELQLATADGERVIAWHVPPRDGRPVIVYFHGNGGNLGHRITRFRALTDAGYGLLALSYRGYGGSSGRPTESGIMLDAKAVYEEAARRYGDRLVLWGESLGTAVAVALAAERAATAVILEAPFISTLALATSHYPIFPVSWMMKDQYRTDLKIAQVTAPVLVMHGERDDIVPIAHGEAIFAAVTAPKRFARFPAGGHVDLGDHGAVAAARAFIDGL